MARLSSRSTTINRTIGNCDICGRPRKGHGCCEYQPSGMLDCFHAPVGGHPSFEEITHKVFKNCRGPVGKARRFVPLDADRRPGDASGIRVLDAKQADDAEKAKLRQRDADAKRKEAKDREKERTRQAYLANARPIQDLPSDQSAFWCNNLGVDLETLVKFDVHITSQVPGNIDKLMYPQFLNGELTAHGIRGRGKFKLTYGIPGKEFGRGMIHPVGDPEDWLPQSPKDPLYCVEGFSDTINGHYHGLCIVGRHNNEDAPGHVADLIRYGYGPGGRREGWPIHIIGENDGKDDGTWAGREGAEKVAAEAFLGLPGKKDVAITFPPKVEKDIRDYLKRLTMAGEEFAGEILRHELQRPDVVEPITEESPCVQRLLATQRPDQQPGSETAQQMADDLAERARGTDGASLGGPAKLDSYVAMRRAFGHEPTPEEIEQAKRDQEEFNEKLKEMLEQSKADRKRRSRKRCRCRPDDMPFDYYDCDRIYSNEPLPRLGKCGVARHFHCPTRQRVVGILTMCKRNACDFCWRVKLQGLFDQARLVFQEHDTIYLWTGPLDDVNAAKERIRRAEKKSAAAESREAEPLEFCRLSQMHGMAALFTSLPGDGLKAMDAEDAIHAFRDCMDRMPRSCKRDFSWSQGWQPADDTEDKGLTPLDTPPWTLDQTEAFMRLCNKSGEPLNIIRSMRDVSAAMTRQQALNMAARMWCDDPGDLDVPYATDIVWGSDSSQDIDISDVLQTERATCPLSSEKGGTKDNSHAPPGPSTQNDDR